MIEVILLEPEHEGNVGAVCRAMANFGFTKLIVVNPQCDLENDEFYKRAKHSKGKIDIKIRKKFPKYDLLVGTTAKINTDYNIKRSPVLSEDLAMKIIPLAKKNKVGILFGREGIGLTNEEVEGCDFIVSINSSKKYSTLNLSHAVVIILYELHKNMKSAKLADNIEMASKVDMKHLLKLMNGVIGKFDFGSTHKNNIQKKIWKGAFSRAVLTKREAHGMMGLLNKLSKSLKNKR